METDLERLLATRRFIITGIVLILLIAGAIALGVACTVSQRGEEDRQGAIDTGAPVPGSLEIEAEPRDPTATPRPLTHEDLVATRQVATVVYGGIMRNSSRAQRARMARDAVSTPDNCKGEIVRVSGRRECSDFIEGYPDDVRMQVCVSSHPHERCYEERWMFFHGIFEKSADQSGLETATPITFK